MYLGFIAFGDKKFANYSLLQTEGVMIHGIITLLYAIYVFIKLNRPVIKKLDITQTLLE